MSGTNTVRGIAFQHAMAIHSILDALRDPDAIAVRIEGLDDVVDVEVLTSAGDLLLGQQMKSKLEPHTWTRQQLIDVIKRWIALPAAQTTRFEFITDGELGPSATKLLDEIQGALAGDDKIAAQLQVDFAVSDLTALARVEIRVRAGSVGEVLDRAETRIFKMLPRALVTDEAAEARTDALFKKISVVGGDPDPSHRIVTAEEIAAILAVDLESLRAEPLSAARAEAYRQSVLASDVAADIVTRTLLASSAVPPALRFLTLDDTAIQEGQRAVTLEEVLASGDAWIVGPSGSGKSTAALQLHRCALEANRMSIVVLAEQYVPGRLDLAITDAIELVTGLRAGSVAADRILADENATLILDGVSELSPDDREALSRDLIDRQRRGMACQLIATGRDGEVLRSTLPGSVRTQFTLDPLTSDDRLRIAVERSRQYGKSLDERTSRELVRRIEDQLDSDKGDPLLFGMAVSVALAEDLPRGRAQLYERLLAGLVSREGLADPDLVVSALGIAFGELLARGARNADRFTWQEVLSDAAAQLAGQTADGPSLFHRALEAGLLVRPSFAARLGAVHDSIGDYLAGRASARGLVTFPDPATRSAEEAISFAAELGPLGDDFMMVLGERNPLLAVRVAQYDFPGRRDDLVETAVIASELLRRFTAGTRYQAVGGLAVAPMGERLAVVVDRPPTELTDEQIRSVVQSDSALVLTTPIAIGPLALATHAWRALLRQSQTGIPTLPPARPTTIEESISAIFEHERGVVESVQGLVHTTMPPAAQSRVLAEFEGTALRAVVGPAVDQSVIPGGHIGVKYSRAGDHIEVVPYDIDAAGRAVAGLTGSTSADLMVSNSPEVEAWHRVITVVNRIAERDWL